MVSLWLSGLRPGVLRETPHPSGCELEVCVAVPRKVSTLPEADCILHSKRRRFAHTHQAPKARERAKHAIPFQSQSQYQYQSLGSHWLTTVALSAFELVSSM